MALLTEFPAGFQKPEPLNKSFDMVVRDWSRQQFGGDAIVEEIRKALSTGAAGQAGGALTQPGEATALRLENLDNTMTSVLATAEHLKVFRFLHKEPSKQPFYQWNRRESYGSTRGFFGFAEGSLPTGGKGQWSRNGAYVKFLGTKGGVTHPVVLTNILGGMSMDPVAEDQLGRTMDFMQRIERAILFGDDNILDGSGGESNYDGLFKQLTVAREKNIIDMKGKSLNLDNIAHAATRLVTEGKLLSFQDITLFMSPQNIEDLGKLRWQTVIGNSGAISGPGTTVDRADLTTSARQNLIAGLSVVGQATSFGVIPFEWSIFMEPVEGNIPLNLTTNTDESGATSAPTAVNSVATSAVLTGKKYQIASIGSTTGAQWTTAGLTTGDTVPAVGTVVTSTASGTIAGTGTVYAIEPTAVSLATAQATTGVYITACGNSSGISNHDGSVLWYAVSSVNDAGESTAVVCPSPVAPSNSQQAVITWVKKDKTTAYRIYRITGGTALPSATDPRWRFVGYVAAGSATNTSFIDRNGTPELYNNFMPGTNISPLVCRNPADLVVAQMSPLLKMPLAPINTTFEYLLLLYHTLVLKAPERQIIFKNVGALA